MKKISGLVAALFMLMSLTAALAWSPEYTYTTRDELPASINAQLPPKLILEQGYLLDRRVLLLMSDGGQYYPYSYYNCSYTQPRGEDYELYNIPMPMTAWQGVPPVMTVESPTLVTLHYGDRYAYTFHFESYDPLGLCQVVIDGRAAFLGRNTLLFDYGYPGNPTRLYGTWKQMPSLSNMKEATLPKTMDELTAMLDQSGWAVVSNSVPTDRLNLRKSASRKGEPIGRYYNGTPVQIVSQTGQWSKVIIGNAEGYMMTKFLMTDQSSVQDAFPGRALLPTAWEENAGMFQTFSTDPIALMRVPLLDDSCVLDIPFIIGFVNDDWVAAMTYSGHYGYMRSEYFTAE